MISTTSRPRWSANSFAGREVVVRSRAAAWLLAGLSIALIQGTAHPEKAWSAADDGLGILRYDPVLGQLVPVPPEEQKVGYIYSHFSSRLGRRVWSFHLGEGNFSFALGEGTLQPARQLDVRVRGEKAVEELQRIAPTLAEQVKRLGGRVFVRLSADDKWELYGLFGVPGVYDAETGRRWESHGGPYIPVRHTIGYRWAVRNGRFVPVPESGGLGNEVFTCHACQRAG